VAQHFADHQGFSFTKSAQLHGEELVNRVVEKDRRLPFDENFDNLYYALESAAQKALGLNEDSEFLVIGRLRLLSDTPCAIHRAYLNPRRFSKTFLEDHDFGTESLVEIYHQRGYKLLSRDTVVQARLPYYNEISLLTPAYRSSEHRSVPRANAVLTQSSDSTLKIQRLANALCWSS